MKLSNLIKNVKTKEIIGTTDVEILSLSIDSRDIDKKSLFFCIKGENFDGHDFVLQAKTYGAKAIVCERRLDTSLTQIIVDNVRSTMSYIMANFYNNPQKKLKIIGITGTNGKTTTSYMIKHVLDAYGISAGVIGTLGIKYNDTFLSPSLTTPDPITLFKVLNDMVNAGVTVVIMEVSAHASKLKKLDAITFYAGVFTNLSLDHLDFFITMENYKNAKLAFLNEKRCKYLVVNTDDVVGREILGTTNKVISYGIENPSDVFAINLTPDACGESFVVNLFDKIYDVKLKVFGKFNVYNALSSMIVCSMLGVPTDKIIEYISTFLGVQGRVERLKFDKKTVFIDYAHTPDGLKKAIDAVLPYTVNRLICLFGCGGNRDKEKRKLMGEISAKNADFSIITTDNPRFEEPMAIIKEVEKGFSGITDEYVLIEDRRDAIRYALKIAKDGDTVLIAGKGGEKYQEILGVKKHFDDKEIVEEFFKG